ncbi:MAG: MFS transporter, partial [Candidatus Aerophobetes bacterium]
KDRGKGYGIIASARALGRAFGPITGGIIASALSLRTIFIFATALFMIVAIWTAIMVKEPKMVRKT